VIRETKARLKPVVNDSERGNIEDLLYHSPDIGKMARDLTGERRTGVADIPKVGKVVEKRL
jgi:hypothetical protein